jgi:hypothetical protein
MSIVRLDLNVFDPAALYEAALASFGSSEDVGDRFGTPESPNVATCIVELLCEHIPVDAGFEVMNWSGT